MNPAPRRRPLFGAYYLGAHVYTVVPANLRRDFEWMAEHGTDYVCVSVLEQDLWAGAENLHLVLDAAEQAGLSVLAVPSRWAGLIAGAPKVPSMFSVLHPSTWLVNAQGRTGVSPTVSGVISSVHAPEVLEFFLTHIDELLRQHPRLAGLVLDEPKGFREDHSPHARARLGPNPTRDDHWRAAADFYGRVCSGAKHRHPDKQLLLFTQVHHDPLELELCAQLPGLDYFGVDGRPWDDATDAAWQGAGDHQESGRGKVLLGLAAANAFSLARQHGKRPLVLVENHNLTEPMIVALERHLPAVFALPADMFLYYYYPRGVVAPERAMSAVASALDSRGRCGR